MSHAITIYGASDDLIEIEGDAPGCDEYNDEAATFILTGPAGAARVRVEYANPGVWEIGVGQVDEGVDLLPMRITGSGYTARAEIEGVALVVREAA